jgi:ribonuclease D
VVRWHTRYRGGEPLVEAVAVDGVEVEWVADDQALARAVAQWQDQIALDTEFIRTNTYFPMPGLYQVASGSQVYLIDPLQINDWQPFVDYLSSTHTVKVMHACLEDLELLHHHLGVTPNNVFDTQFANAFLSADFSLSYTALVERLLGQTLEQHETRSNWLQRPLTDEQIHYAVEDVTFLLPMYDNLLAGLGQTSRVAWYDADMNVRGVYQPVQPDVYYRNIKKAWQLVGQQLAVLQVLCAWRELTARHENVPRNRVIWDEHLFEFARKQELQAGHVHQALPKGVARRYADVLVEQHAMGRDAQAPDALPKPLTTAQGATLKRLRDVARAEAMRLDLAPELLARKKDLEACVRHHADYAELSPHYSSWRSELVGDAFLGILQQARGYL